MQINHVLLGWHRGFAGGIKVEHWLQQRKNVLVETLSVIPGGKNVANYMIEHGWLELGPQVKTAKRSRAITPHKLKFYDIILLPNHKTKPEHIEGDYITFLSVGFIDKRLKVYNALIQTPIIFANDGGPVNHPRRFRLFTEQNLSDDATRTIFRKQLDFFSESINRSMRRYIHNWLSLSKLEKEKMSCSRNNSYPVFRADGTRHSKYRVVHQGDCVRLLVELQGIICNVAYYYNRWVHIFTPSWVIHQLQTLQKPNVDVLFVDDDDDLL